MNKEIIIKEIKRTAHENGGKPLGQEKFARETGIQVSHWQKYWVKWSQALNDADFEPNKYNGAYSDDHVLEKLSIFIRELKHYPVKAELKMKAKDDKSFPSHTVFDRIGTKQIIVSKLKSFCDKNNNFNDIAIIINNELEKLPITDNDITDEKRKGYVYIVKHGNRNEYKIGRTNNPIRREGELTIELPEKLIPIHWIETDDPNGIEKYWHNRFSEKRKNGEWFNLTIEDVRAFKRWKKIF